MFGFRTASARRRVAKAVTAYRLAYQEWNEANARQDTRRMKTAGVNHERMEAEIALAALEAPSGAQVAR